LGEFTYKHLKVFIFIGLTSTTLSCRLLHRQLPALTHSWQRVQLDSQIHRSVEP
jgi:hypothetical protein